MNKLFTKIASLSIGLALAIGVGVAAGSKSIEASRVDAAVSEVARIEFNTGNTTSGNTSTQLTSSVNISTYGTQSPSNYFGTKASAASTSYYASKTSKTGAGQGGIRVGKSSGTGSVTFTLATAITNASSVEIVSYQCSSGKTLSVAQSSDGAITPTSSSATYSFSLSSNLSAITINTSGQLWITSIVLYAESGGSTASLSIDEAKHLDFVGNDFDLEATATGYTPTSWTWSSNPAGIVSIDDDEGYAIITPLAAGTTTITVSAPNGTTSMTKTCAVTVTSVSGADLSNVFTIDDAILAANYYGTTSSTNSYYMEGLVDHLYTDKNNRNFPMLQGTDSTLEVYTDCSNTVFAGDTIRAYGKLKVYNTQAEFDSGTEVTVINVPVDSVSVTNPTAIPTKVTNGNLGDYLSVTISGTNDRDATNQNWKVTNSSDASVISISGEDGKTFNSSSTVGTTTLTIASVADSSKTANISITLFDASAPVLQSVTVSGTPTKPTQYVGKEFDWSGLSFEPVYSPVKEPVETIDGDDIEWEALAAGQHPTGSYTGDGATVQVIVESVSVEVDGVYAVYVSGDMSTKTYDEEAPWNYAGLVVKVTLKSDHDTKVAPTSTINWNASATPKQLGVGSKKSVNVTATVDNISSSAYLVEGITINEHQADKYGLYSGALVEGDYVIVYDGKAMNTTVSSDRLQYSELTITDNVIEDPDSSIIWHIAASGNYWTLYNAAANAYAAGTGAKNKAQMLADGTDDKSMWTVSGTSTYDFVNKANAAASVNANLRENGTYGFACYATSTGGALSLYKLNYLPKAWASFNYVDATPNKTSYMVGESFDPTGLEIRAVYTEPSIYPEEDITDDIVWDALVEGTQATGTWDGHTVTITGLTISSFTPVTYTKLTSLDQLAVGSEVIIGGYKESATTYYVLNGFSSSFFTAGTTTATSSTMSTTSDTLIFTVEADRNGYYFKHGSDYIKRSNSNSGFGEKDSNACWTISFGDEGAVSMINGADGNKQFQFNDSDPRFKNYSGTQKSIFIYVKSAASETDVLRTYASRYLLLDNETLAQIPSSETGQGGTDCLGTTGPYMTAKTALNSGEFASHKENFKTSSDSIIANARLRFESWAKAYGDSTPYSSTTGSSKISLLNAIGGQNSSATLIVIIISAISAASIGGYFLFRKKKED